jgi:hypothetical protein
MDQVGQLPAQDGPFAELFQQHQADQQGHRGDAQSNPRSKSERREVEIHFTDFKRALLGRGRRLVGEYKSKPGSAGLQTSDQMALYMPTLTDSVVATVVF